MKTIDLNAFVKVKDHQNKDIYVKNDFSELLLRRSGKPRIFKLGRIENTDKLVPIENKLCLRKGTQWTLDGDIMQNINSYWEHVDLILEKMYSNKCGAL